jgi:septum formation protein
VADGPTGPDPGGQPALVLASGSHRRRELLQRIGLAPIVRPADLDESPLPGEPAEELVLRLALEKAAASAAQGPPGADEVVLAADTEVVLDGRALGKPVDREDAERMLWALAGRTHQVMTGLAVRRGSRVATERAVTSVTFRSLTAAEVAWYLATGEPQGKAGAYALQGAGAVLVEQIDGSDTNVIGLPLAAAVALLRQLGCEPFPSGTRDAR